VKAYLDRQLEERLNHLSGQVEDVRLIAVESRRLAFDQLDASTEATALLARAIEDLKQAVAELGEVLGEPTGSAGRSDRDGSAPAAK
jgi:hypothetical protein